MDGEFGRGNISAIKVPKAAELIAAEVRRRVATGQLKPGDLLPTEAELMAEFGVSRPVLREAFRVLESESVLDVTRGVRGGSRVRTPDGEAVARYLGAFLQYRGTLLSDVYRARTEIEVAAVGMLGRANTSGAEQLAESAARGWDLLDDETAFADFSLAFHQAVVQTASPTLGTLSDTLFRIIEAHNAAFIAAHPRGYEQRANLLAVRAYQRLAETLMRREAVAAQQQWRAHLVAVERFMVGDSRSSVIDVLG